MSDVNRGFSWAGSWTRRQIEDYVLSQKDPGSDVPIYRIELLKDLRPLEHYTHEFLVFSFRLEEKGEKYLYLEREASDASPLIFPILRYLARSRPFSFLLSPSCRRILAPLEPLLKKCPLSSLELDSFTLEEPSAGDLLNFLTPGEEDDEERRCHVQSIFEVQPNPSEKPFTLRSLVKLMRDLQTKHPKYRLLGANCWSWSRAMLLSIILDWHNIQSATYKGRTLTFMELKVYLTTMYGAWGGLLLRFIGM
jgi:hypothetical protein